MPCQSCKNAYVPRCRPCFFFGVFDGHGHILRGWVSLVDLFKKNTRNISGGFCNKKNIWKFEAFFFCVRVHVSTPPWKYIWYVILPSSGALVLRPLKNLVPKKEMTLLAFSGGDVCLFFGGVFRTKKRTELCTNKNFGKSPQSLPF